MSATPSAEAAFAQMLDPAMQSYIDQGKVAGMVYLVQKGNQVVHSASLGSLRKETATPMRPDALFRIMSLTKPITATAVMMLVENGQLTLKDPVSRFIPAFDSFKVLVNPAEPYGERENLARPITVLDLLTNVSGLSYGIFDDAPIEDVYREADLLELPLAEMIDRLVTLPLAFQPGTAWRYGIGFDVLGYLVQRLSDAPFDRFLEERIFGPLGMENTFFVVPESALDCLTAVYTNPDFGDVVCCEEPDISPFLEGGRPLSGGGGLVSTAHDYLRFMTMLRNGGELDGVRILRPETVAQMVTNKLPASMIPIVLAGIVLEGIGYGLGMGICVGDSDWAGGMGKGTYWWLGYDGTCAWVDPQRDLIGVFMAQAVFYHEPSIVTMNIVNRIIPVV